MTGQRFYYDCDRDGLPRQWIARVKRAIRSDVNRS
jgi:hypothetical protein